MAHYSGPFECDEWAVDIEQEGLGWARPRRMDKGSDCAKKTHNALFSLIAAFDNTRFFFKKAPVIMIRYSLLYIRKFNL